MPISDIKYAWLADCKTQDATCTSQECTAPGSVKDGGACTAQSGTVLRPVVLS